MSGGALLCTFRVGDLLLGLPVEEVQEVLFEQPLTPVPLAPEAVAGLLNLRGRIVTVIDLRRRLGLGAEDRPGARMKIVLGPAAPAACLLVDAVGDVVELAPGAIEAPPPTLSRAVRDLVRGLSRDGERLVLVLDSKRVAELDA